MDAFPTDRTLRFALAVAHRRLTLVVEDKKVFDAEVPPGFDVAHGAWGVGCHNGAVVFSVLEVMPLAK
jgi:hypothetical protein